MKCHQFQSLKGLSFMVRGSGLAIRILLRSSEVSNAEAQQPSGAAQIKKLPGGALYIRLT